MKSEKEKLREMMLDFAREDNGAADKIGTGSHLRDEDFIRLIKNAPVSETADFSKNNGFVENNESAEIAALRSHLVGCESCLADFRDFYAFFAPAETADKNEISDAWQAFAPRIEEKKEKPNFWANLFSRDNKPRLFASLGWATAGILLVLTAIMFFALRQEKTENRQLAEQLENQKQTLEERLKTIEQAGQNSLSAEEEKERLTAEKADLEKRILALQTEMERVRREPQTVGDMTPPSEKKQTVPPEKERKPAPEKTDSPLIAVNTPIYDVFPSDSAVRSGEAAANKLIIPNAARTVVLILNAAGRADFPDYQAQLLSSSGKIIWRGAGLKKDDSGNFTLTLSGTVLKSGNYRLKLFSGAQTIAEYNLTVEIK